MVKIPLTVKQINALLKWRDEHKELVRVLVVPFPCCEIISENGDEFEAIKILIRKIENGINSIREKESHHSACLMAIKKINAGKNDAINSLCE